MWLKITNRTVQKTCYVRPAGRLTPDLRHLTPETM